MSTLTIRTKIVHFCQQSAGGDQFVLFLLVLVTACVLAAFRLAYRTMFLP